ncbi:MAG: hypothetical protein ACHQQ3_02875 [Gemmatimonadales bacterium]
MRPRHLVTLLFLALPPALSAQAVVDPGMSKAQVIAKLGPPAIQKSSGNSTYLYYKNGAERKVGMSDLVVLEGDKVVDAVFRSSARKYSGTSSSPAAIPAEVARKNPLAGGSASTKGAAPMAPRAAAPPAQAGAPESAKQSQKMPAQKANEAKAVAPTPQARSAMLEQQKAAAKAADSSKAAKAADSTKAAKKPDPASPPPKKP